MVYLVWIIYSKLEYCDMLGLDIILVIRILWYIRFELYSKLEYCGMFIIYGKIWKYRVYNITGSSDRK